MSRRTRLLFQLAFAAITLGLLFWVVDVRALADALSSAQLSFVAASFVISFIALIVTSAKWGLLLASRGVSIAVSQLLRLNLVAAFYATILPGQIAGEGVKVYRLIQRKESASLLVASVAVDRLTGLIGMLALGIVGAATAGLVTQPAGQVMIIALVTLIGVVVMLPFFGRRSTSANEESAGVVRRALAIGARLATAMHEYHRQKRAVGVALVLSVVFQALLTYGLLLLAMALSIDVSYADLVWIFAVTSIVQMLPITVAGLGTREGTMVYLLGLQGVAHADALALSLLLFACNLVLALVGGALELSAGIRPGHPAPSSTTDSSA